MGEEEKKKKKKKQQQLYHVPLDSDLNVPF